MNRIYKLVYSRTLNNLVAVSEISDSHAVGGVDKRVDLSANANSTEKSKLGNILLGAALLAGAPAVASAAPNAQQNNKQPTQPVATQTLYDGKIQVDEVSASKGLSVKDYSGTAVVNIVKADENGVSDNRFKAFSTQKGAVFNNAVGGNGTTVQVESKILGQKIAANANLRQAAKAILAQVTGNDKSVINGALEVLGQKADLIIVNPKGIDLNGNTLFNVKDFTASTAEVSADNYKTMKVQQGEINLNGDLTTDDVNMIRLIANAVKLKATIAPSKGYKGKKADIVVSAGKQTFDLNTNTAKALEGASSNEEPRVAISGSNLGSMYGNKVNFIVTESGAGVEYDGLVMGDDNIEITADGKVQVNKVLSKEGDVKLASKSSKVEVGTAKATERLNKEATGTKKLKDGVVTTSVSATTTTSETEIRTEVNTETTVTETKEQANAKNPKSKFVSGKNVDISGKKVAVENALVSGKQKTTLTATQAGTDADVGISVKSGVVSGKEVVAEAGSKIHFDNQSKLLADNVKLKAGQQVRVDGLLYADKANLEATGVQGGVAANVLIGGKVVTNELSTTAEIVGFTSGSDVTSGTVNVDAKTRTLFSGAKVKADTLSVKGHSIKDSVTVTNSELAANTVNLDLDTGLTLKTAEDFAAVDKLLGKVISNNKNITVDDIAIAKGAEITKTAATSFAVRNKFVNYGILNLSHKNFDQLGDASNQQAGKSVVITTGKTFENYGLLVADRLGVKSAQEIKFDGLTFVYNDLTLISPKVTQHGSVEVGGNLNAITDQYEVTAKLVGEAKINEGSVQVNTHYADHSLRRDYYEIYSQIGSLDGSEIKVSGGKIAVKGDFTIVPLAGSNFAKGTESEGKDVADVRDLTRLKAQNADIYVGGNLALDGDLENTVKAFETTVADLLKVKSVLKLKYKPTTWIKTDLMAQKEQTFDSLYSMFDAIFGNDKNFSWYNGAYGMNGDHILDTFKGNLADAQTNKVLSVVFGSDWRKKGYNDLRTKWNEFKSNPEGYRVALWAPGAQIVTGGSIDQINGSVKLGSDAANTTVLKNAEGRNYSIKVEQANALASKAERRYSLDETLSDLQQLGVVKKDASGKYVSRFNIPFLDNVADISLFAPKGSSNLIGDNQAAAQLILEQVKSKTGSYYFATNTDANIVNGLLTETVRYEKALQNAKDRFTKQYAAAGTSTVLKQAAEKVFATEVARIKATYDYIEFVKVSGSTGNQYTPVVVFSEKTLDRAKTLGASAAVLNAGEAVRIHNAKYVKSNYGTIAADTVAIKAKTIDLTTDGVQNAVIANKSGFKAEDFNLTGSAAFGVLSLEADNATFESAARLNDAGDLEQVGTAYADSAKLDIANDLTMKGFTFVAKDDSQFNVGGNLDLLSKYEVASRYSKEALKNTLGSSELYEAAYTVKGSTVVADKTLEVNVGGDAQLESSRMAAEEKLEVNVEGDFSTAHQKNVYEATRHEEKVDLVLGGKVDFGSYHVEGNSHLATSSGAAFNETIVDKDASFAKTGQPAVTAGLSLTYSASVDKVSEVKTANSALDSTNLELNVRNNADVSNLDINKAAQEIAERRADENKTEVEVPTATITAGSVTTNDQGVDNTLRDHESSSLSIGVDLYAGGSVVDVASHVTSAARADSLDRKLDGTLALTAVGDATGIMTRDLATAGVRARIGGESQSSNQEVTADNRNTLAGNVVIKTDDDINLKAVDGEKLNTLKLEAGTDVNIEGGTTKVVSSSTTTNAGLSTDLSVGASVQGAAAAVSQSINFGQQFSNSEANLNQNSVLDAKSVEIKAENANLVATTINAETAKVDVEEKLSITSKQDTVESTTNGYNVGLTGGASLNTATQVTPFGAVSAGYNHHKVDNKVVAEQSGITATEALEVKANEAELVGAKVVAQDSEGNLKKATVDVKQISATDVEDTRYEDGGSVGLSVGTNKYGSVTVDVSGGRDKQDHYSATNKATIAGEGVDVAANVIKGTVNTDANTAVDVHYDDQYQDTAFGITVNENVVNQVKQGTQKVKEVASKAKEVIGDAVGAVVEKVKSVIENAELPDVTFAKPDTDTDVSFPEYNTHYITDAGETRPTVTEETRPSVTDEGGIPEYRPHPVKETDADAQIAQQQTQAADASVVEQIKAKAQKTQDSERTVPWIVPTTEELATALSASTTSSSAETASSVVAAASDDGFASTFGAPTASSRVGADAASATESSTSGRYTDLSDGDASAFTLITNSQYEADGSIVSENRFIVRDGTAYPVYYPHGSLAGKLVIDGPGSQHTVYRGTVNNSGNVVTEAGVFNRGTGYYEASSSSSTVSYSSTSSSSSYSSSLASSSSSLAGSNTGSYSSSSTASGSYYSSTSTTAALNHAAESVSTSSYSSSSSTSSPVEAALARANARTTGHGSVDAPVVARTVDTLSSINTGSSYSSSLTGSSSTRTIVEAALARANAQPSHSSSSSESSSLVFAGAYDPCSCTSTTTSVRSTSTTSNTDSIRPTLSRSYSTSDVVTGTTTRPSIDRSNSWTAGTTSTTSGSSLSTSSLSGSTSSLSSTTTTTDFSPSTTTFSGRNPTTPSHLELTEMDGLNSLQHQYARFNETGNVDAKLSGTYSEIFAGKAGSAQAGKGGGLSAVETADQLLKAREVPQFSNFVDANKVLKNELASATTELEVLRSELASVTDPTAVQELQAQVSKAEEVVRTTEARLEETETQINRVHSDERNTLDYVRETFEVDLPEGKDVTATGKKVVEEQLTPAAVKEIRTVTDFDAVRETEILEFVGVEEEVTSKLVDLNKETGEIANKTPVVEETWGSSIETSSNPGPKATVSTPATEGTPAVEVETVVVTNTQGETVTTTVVHQPENPVDFTKDEDLRTTITNPEVVFASAQDVVPASEVSTEVPELVVPEPVDPADQNGGGNATGGNGNTDTGLSGNKDPYKPGTGDGNGSGEGSNQGGQNPSTDTNTGTDNPDFGGGVDPTDPNKGNNQDNSGSTDQGSKPENNSNNQANNGGNGGSQGGNNQGNTQGGNNGNQGTNQGGSDNNQTGSNNNQGGSNNNQGGSNNNQGGNTGGNSNNQGGNVDGGDSDLDPVIPVTPVNPVDPTTPIDGNGNNGGNGNTNVGGNNVPSSEIDKIRDDIRKFYDDEFRHYEEKDIPTMTPADINFDDQTFAFMDDLDGNIRVPGQRTGRVQFASSQPKGGVDVAVPGRRASASGVASTAPRKPTRVGLSSAKRPAVVVASNDGAAVSTATTTTVSDARPSKVTFSSAKPTKVTLSSSNRSETTYANTVANPNASKFLSEVDDTIDSLSCVNPLVGNLNNRIEDFRGDALVINRSMSEQPDFENVLASINSYEKVFGIGKEYGNVDELRTDLGYRTAAAQLEAERQDTLKRKQIDFSSTQLQQVAAEIEKLRQRALELRENVRLSNGSNQDALAAELEQIRQQEIGLLKQYKDLRTAIYSLTDGYNFGFTVTNDAKVLNRLLQNLVVVSNGDDARTKDDVYVTIKNLDTYLYGTQSVKYSSVQRVKRVVTFDNYAENSADYNDDKKLYNETQEAISINAKNLRMRVANLHLEVKAIADDYQAILAKADSLTESERDLYNQKLDYIKSTVQGIIVELNDLSLASNVDLVKTMASVTDLENQVLEVRNEVSDLLGGKAAALKFANASKQLASMSVLEDKEKAQAIVDSVTGGQQLAGGIKLYNPRDIDVLTKTEVRAVNTTANLRDRARKARLQRTSNDSGKTDKSN